MKTLILTLFIAILCSCEQEKIAPTIQIGQSMNDGRVFYIFSTKDKGYIEGEQHGYIVSEDLGITKWGCNGPDLSLFSQIGKDNTTIINNTCGSNNAAGECLSKQWWLPSSQEWQLIINSKIITFTDEVYWTSNKYSYNTALLVKPSKNEFYNDFTTKVFKVRGIKQF